MSPQSILFRMLMFNSALFLYLFILYHSHKRESFFKSLISLFLGCICGRSFTIWLLLTTLVTSFLSPSLAFSVPLIPNNLEGANSICSLLPSGLCMCHISSGERDCQDGHRFPPLPESTLPAMWLPLKRWGPFLLPWVWAGPGTCLNTVQWKLLCSRSESRPPKGSCISISSIGRLPSPCEWPWASLLENERAVGKETSSPSSGHAIPTAPSQSQSPSSSLWMYSQVQISRTVQLCLAELLAYRIMS